MPTRLMDWIVKPALICAGLSGAASPAIGLAAEVQRARPDSFVDVSTLVPDAVLDVRYAGTHNFVGTPVDGYGAARCLLTRPAAEALAQVAESARAQGYRVKLFDCYRPARAVAHFARWAADLADTHTKGEYYPDLDKGDLFTLGYIAARSGHSRGSTLDLTLVEAASGAELDMGTPFDLFSDLSWPGSDAVTEVQKANRQRLAQLMSGHGFQPFDKEWWHFTLANELFPDTYFDFPID
ncbi:M15 family metallopeptidase [Xanthobacter sp. ZOL 2024]